MMVCRQCGAELTAEQKFCSACGTPTHPCSNCHQPCLPDARFCGQCGTALTPLEQSTIPTKPRIIPLTGAGETHTRKHATMLFADLKGSTS